jgi:hypothetical protein
VLPPAGGVWDINQIRRLAFDSITDPAEGGDFPLAVYDLGASSDAEWGLVNDAQESDFTFYYVTKEELTDTTIRARGQALKSALFAGSFTGMSVLRMVGENADMNPILEFFLMRSVPYTAGSITMRIVYGESAL